MAGVHIRNLVKRFTSGRRGTDTLAVNDVNLEIADGEFLILLGPSGCGKTTTLRCVAGLERQTSGDILIGERIVNDLPPADRDIAFVFQFYALYPHLSAYDNIAFPLRAQGIERRAVDTRVKQVAATLRIAHILDRRPQRLSSGEQQRVALGRAMVRRPQVFLMDEPLTNLDPALRADMRVELKHLQHELQATTIYVTHDQIEAMSMSHRLAVMDRGLLQQVGTPLDVYNHPATIFVAGFIGSPPMNLLTGRIIPGPTPTFVKESGDLQIPLAGAILDRARQVGGDSAVVLGVRSEDIRLVGAEAADLRGEISVREPLGDEYLYGVQVGDSIIRARTPATQRWQTGLGVGLALDWERAHLFDAASGQAIA
jgi:ABC-type sugar transport system ATPase subunit